MIVHSYYPLGEPRVEREAKAARDAGYLVDVIALRGEQELPREVVDGITVRRLAVRHVRGAPLGRMVGEYLGFALLATVTALRMHARSLLSLVQVHAPPDFLIVAGLLPRLLGARLVLDIHDLSPHMYPARFGRQRGAGFLVRLLVAIERIACAAADAVVTVHEPYRRELARHGVPPEKTRVVMNSPDETLIERVAARAGADARSDIFTVAYHGTITQWYGVDVIVEAIARLRDSMPKLRAVVIGEGDALASARALADRLGVNDSIEFSGRYLPLEDALLAVAKADCGVIPNRNSTLNRFALSSKLFEYVALGVPVVVSSLETLTAHFAPDEATFFRPGDPVSLAKAIQWVAEHRQEADRKAERAKSRLTLYSWSENRRRYLGLLEDLLERGRPSTAPAAKRAQP